MTATLDALRDEMLSGAPSAAYRAKQLHTLPEAPVLAREAFLIAEATGQVVLDVGASGPMHAAIAKVATHCYGLDREDGPDVVGCDLDDPAGALPVYPDVTRIICGEVLEHLSNPGFFLSRLRAAYQCRTIITVPNAHSVGGQRWLQRGIECVNIDHTCWFSWRTLKTLLERHGYAIQQFAWYNGPPGLAEGLIVVTE